MADRRKRKKKRDRKKELRRRLLLVAGMVLACVLVAVVCVQAAFQRKVQSVASDRMLDGVFLGQSEVSGMTREEAIQTVQKEMETFSSEKTRFDFGSGRNAEATFQELGIEVRGLEKIVDQAMDYGKKGSLLNRYRIVKKAEKGKNKKVFPIEYRVTEEGAKAAIETAASPYLKAPVDARLEWKNGALAVVPDEPGEMVDIGQTVEQINDQIKGDWDRKGITVSAAIGPVLASVTEEDLGQATDLLGRFSTYYGDSGSGRAKNVESGASHINGTFVEPGEEVSVNGLMEPYTEENGYAMAASYANGEVVQSMGGGICQVSSTLYNALLEAEVEITERFAHSMLVSYVKPSMDAAIADNVKDLKFRNDRETPIYLVAVFDGSYVTFHVYGKETRESGRKIRFESETIKMDDPPSKKYVSSQDKIGVMYAKSSAHRGQTAQLWKVVTMDGKEVSREKVNYSKYRSSGATVAVGVSSEDDAAVQKMKAAISTQDEEKIKAAIAEIQRPKEKPEETPQQEPSQEESNQEPQQDSQEQSQAGE